MYITKIFIGDPSFDSESFPIRFNDLHPSVRPCRGIGHNFHDNLIKFAMNGSSEPGTGPIKIC